MHYILSIAGSDSSGGAGIQVDIRTITQLGGYARAVVTALTAQTKAAVTDVEPVSVAGLEQQLVTALDDGRVACIKTGMLVDADRVAVIGRVLARCSLHLPLIVDPVMMSSSGRVLLDSAGVEALKTALLPRVLLVTPNLLEAAALIGEDCDTIDSEQAMLTVARKLQLLGARNVLIKGGHLEGEYLCDVLLLEDGKCVTYRHRRQDGVSLRGTGCRLSTAIAYYYAEFGDVLCAVEQGIDWLQGELSR